MQNPHKCPGMDTQPSGSRVGFEPCQHESTLALFCCTGMRILSQGLTGQRISCLLISRMTDFPRAITFPYISVYNCVCVCVYTHFLLYQCWQSSASFLMRETMMCRENGWTEVMFVYHIEMECPNRRCEVIALLKAKALGWFCRLVSVATCREPQSLCLGKEGVGSGLCLHCTPDRLWMPAASHWTRRWPQDPQCGTLAGLQPFRVGIHMHGSNEC